MNALMDHKHSLLLEHAGLSRPGGDDSDDGPGTDPGTGSGDNSPDGNGPIDKAAQNAALVMSLLHTAARIDKACAAELASFDLTEARLSVMLVVAREPKATPAFIASSLGVTRAAVTGLLDGLERQEYITRRGSASDRRSSAITLTSAGSAALDGLAPRYRDWLTALSAGITQADTRATFTALGILQQNVQALDVEGTR